MKTKLLLCWALICLLGAAKVRAEGATNVVHRSCCQAMESCSKPLADKSLYQLDATWTNDNGQSVNLSALRGRPQVIVMFFAHCQYACPLLVYQAQQLEAALPANLRKNVGFTLVSFDSRRDTPAALKDYRNQHGLSPANWTLLHGDPDAVLDLAALLGVNFKEDAQGQFSHSNIITLLNAEGEIVHQQSGLNSDKGELVQAIEKLPH
jgi:protein SCO1/2